MSALTSIPPRHRFVVYAVYTTVVVILGAIGVGYLSAGALTPTWHTVATDVAAYIGGALGLVAAANVQRGGQSGGDDDSARDAGGGA